MTVPGGNLPRVDQHSVVVQAPPEAVWEATLTTVEWSSRPLRTGLVVRALGCQDVSVRGPRPLTVGSAFPGFHVVTAEAPRELWLAGGHRFSDYALIFRLEALADGTVRLIADSRARFPGLHGTIYRTLVIGSRGHVLAVKRLLASVKHRAEHP
jgi:hypothetical protein